MCRKSDSPSSHVEWRIEGSLATRWALLGKSESNNSATDFSLNHHLIGFVDFFEPDFDVAARIQINLLADVIGGDG